MRFLADRLQFADYQLFHISGQDKDAPPEPVNAKTFFYKQDAPPELKIMDCSTPGGSRVYSEE